MRDKKIAKHFGASIAKSFGIFNEAYVQDIMGEFFSVVPEDERKPIFDCLADDFLQMANTAISENLSDISNRRRVKRINAIQN